MYDSRFQASLFFLLRLILVFLFAVEMKKIQAKIRTTIAGCAKWPYDLPIRFAPELRQE